VNRIRTTLARLALLFASTACASGTETGNPPVTAELDISVLSREAPTQGLVLDEARIFLRRLSLVPCAADAASLSTYDFPVDLLHQPPARVTFESSVSEYCGVRLALAPFGGSTPAELAGLSTLVRGVRSDDAPFELRSTLETTLELVSANGPLDATKLVLGVTPEHWFTDADVHGASTSPEGVALIDAEHNPDVLAAFDAATPLAFALYVDTNGDGELTDEELAPVAIAAP
jgi:hypothetical protein